MQCERDQCALNAHCLDPDSNQFECGLIFVNTPNRTHGNGIWKWSNDHLNVWVALKSIRVVAVPYMECGILLFFLAASAVCFGG